MALSRRETSLRPARARHSRDHFGTVSVRSKLPPQCVPVSPSSVSREASRDCVALDRPFDDDGVQTANVAVSASTVSANIMDDLIFMFTAKRLSCFRHFRLDETAKTDVSDQRGRKTAELHTSGVKRADTWRRRVKW